MKCKKCVNDIPDNSRFCPACGHAFSKKTKVKRVVIAVAVIIIALILPVFAMFCGIYIGETHTRISDKMPDIVKISSERLKEVTEVPFEAEITQSEISAVIKQNEEKMQPLKNVSISFPDQGGVTVNGIIEKDRISSLTGSELPFLVMLLLPEEIDISIHAEPSVKDGRIIAGISSFSVAGLSMDKGMLEGFGADDIIADITESAIGEKYGDKIKIEDISIVNSKSGEKALKVKVRYYVWK